MTAKIMTERVIQVDALARVEGEGALYVKVTGGAVDKVEFRIFEPPRFFEAFLVGRDAHEAPDITSRICGICPIAYVMSASQAMEMALGLTVTPEIHALRRILYCGEWIQSHVLHAAMLHAPDFLGLDDAIQIAQTHPEVVRKALRLKKIGNSLMEAVGGRSVHPVNTRVGGFYRAPERAALEALLPELDWGAQAARDLTLAFAAFDFPDDTGDYHFVSLIHPEVYPIAEGRIGSSRGLDIAPAEFNAQFVEEHVARSNALQGRMRDGSTYLVGPLARYVVGYAKGHEDIKNQVDGLLGVMKLPLSALFSTLGRTAARALEAEYCTRLQKHFFDKLISTIRNGDSNTANVEKWDPSTWPKEAKGVGATEAPRGALGHWIRIKDGRIENYQCVVPTTWNGSPRDTAGNIGAFEAALMDTYMERPDEPVEILRTLHSFDPCLACSTHVISPDGSPLTTVKVR